MQISQLPLHWIAVMIMVVFASVQCQENESRRAVSEHQLMHDRGRNIQSLMRLIWLSSAIEGLHTAQTRSAAFSPLKGPQSDSVSSAERCYCCTRAPATHDAETPKSILTSHNF